MYDRYLSTSYAQRNDLSEAGLAKAASAYGREFGRFLPRDVNDPILEIGCGVGAFLRCCRDRGHNDVEGIDLSAEQVAFCRAEGFDRVIQADALTFLTDGQKRYELILMSDVLEHLPRDEVVPTLAAAGSRLRPAGRLVIRVPNLSNPFNLRTRYVDFTHQIGLSRESLAQVLRMAELVPEQIYGSHARHRRWLAYLVFDRLLWKLFRLFYRHTMQLKDEPSRGKNLIAVATPPPREVAGEAPRTSPSS